jgi:hypothetical protein
MTADETATAAGTGQARRRRLLAGGPGVVRVEDWRPDTGTATAERSALWGAVGRKAL